MSLAFGAIALAADAAETPDGSGKRNCGVCLHGELLVVSWWASCRLERETPRAKVLFRYNPAMFRGAVSRLWPPDAALLRAGAGPQPAALESLAPGPANALDCDR
jgi:hypothetical protein